MKLSVLIKKIALSKEKFIVDKILKNYCKELNIDYIPTIKYLLYYGYVVRILRGIFYIKSIEERKLRKLDISYLSALKRALEIKNINNWYFGLETALKFNNITHEYFSIDYLLNDTIFRPKPVKIMGHTIKFIKIHKKLFNFGIIKKDINYSDIEKTLLDIIYLSKYHGLNKDSIKNKIKDILRHSSKNKLIKYSKNYPKTVQNFIRELI